MPDSIANKIIEVVKELSPIYAKATIYNTKGVLSIPCYGADSSDDVQAAYATEFKDLTAHQGKFTSVDLSALTVGALAKISKSLINNTDIDVLNFIIRKVAKAIADFIEKELLVGTGESGHMTGATTTTNLNTLTTKTVAGYGTYLRRHGADIYTIAKVLGHRSIDVTSNTYVHSELSALRKAMKFINQKEL